MKTLLTLLCLCLILGLGCEIPYTGRLGPEGFNGWIESEENGFVCLWNGFDRLCIKTIPGRDGKDGKDGQTLIAIHEVRVEVVVDRIIKETVTEIEYVDREVVIERVSTEFIDREVPIEVFVGRTQTIIKEVCSEKDVIIKEVPVEKIVEVVKTVYVNQDDPVSVTAGATYTESGYHNPPAGYHAHSFTHTHDGATHTHRVIHPDGEKDDWAREHDGFSGLAHD
ncbi:MAG: hypothetical protein OXH00_26000 [Candidatus Poribacteria bacterium]|nr:hypothetical protein [Candidatus Poribacteria bacterium]